VTTGKVAEPLRLQADRYRIEGELGAGGPCSERWVVVSLPVQAIDA
jgi:hypothetical protein